MSGLWPKTKSLTVEVQTRNESAVAFWRAIGYSDYSIALETCRETDCEEFVDTPR